MDFWPVLIFVGFLALVVVLVIVAYYYEKKRTEAMGKAADLMSFTFSPKAPPALLAQYSLFNVFQAGHSKQGWNLMEGQVGDVPIVLLDYRYSVGGGKNKQTNTQTLVVLPNGAVGLPEFQLAPESIFHKIGQLFGYKDLDFDENKEFSKRYLLRGSNEEAIRKVFTAEALEHLAQHAGWSVESRAGQLVAYKARWRCDPRKCPEFIADVLSIQRLFAAPGEENPIV